MKLLSQKTAALFDLGSTLIEYENIPWSEIFGICLRRAYDFLRTTREKLPEWDSFCGHFITEAQRTDQESLRTQRERNIYDFFREFLKRYGITGYTEFEESFLRAYYEPIRENLTIKEGVIKTLEFFKARGLKMGLVSNTIFPKVYHLEDMKYYKIAGYFDEMLFSSETNYRKPHVSIFEEIMARLDICAANAFFTGDRIEIDVAGARQAGILAILLRKAGRDYRDTSTADLVINDLSELIDYY